MAELEVWRNRGVRDPADIIEAHQARTAKKTKGCFACLRRPRNLGGTGSCKHNIRAHGCGFIHGEDQ